MNNHLPKIHLTVPKGSPPKLYLYRKVIHPVKRVIAKYYLVFLRKFFGLKVIGITGSAGKTTTKEMLTSILKLEGKTAWSYANIDPVYNIPSTIFRCCLSTRYLILEMGVEYPGEMDFYLWLAKPDIGAIINIYSTHTEFFGDVEGVLREKIKLARALDKEDCLILNKEDNRLVKSAKNLKAKIIWFGTGTGVSYSDLKLNDTGSTDFKLTVGENSSQASIPISGEQFVKNALAAAALATSLGIPFKKITDGLKKFFVPEHRMNIFRHFSGALIVDDCYNNNPAAFKEALKTFCQIAGKNRKVIVFGDMLELGRNQEKIHRETGRMIADSGIEYLIGVGKNSHFLIDEAQKCLGEEKVIWFETSDRVYSALKPFLKLQYAILIKGSHSIALEKLVAKLE